MMLNFYKVLIKLKFSDDWDMLYLSGTVRSRYGSIKDDWVRMACWTTHAYIINLTNKKLVSDILNAVNYTKRLIIFILKKYILNINIMHNQCLLFKKDIVILKRQMLITILCNHLYMDLQPEHKVVDGNYVLKVDNINDMIFQRCNCIPTYNRRKLFSLAIKNYYDFNYPRNKMKWVIIDDSDDGGVEILLIK